MHVHGSLDQVSASSHSVYDVDFNVSPQLPTVVPDNSSSPQLPQQSQDPANLHARACGTEDRRSTQRGRRSTLAIARRRVHRRLSRAHRRRGYRAWCANVELDRAGRRDLLHNHLIRRDGHGSQNTPPQNSVSPPLLPHLPSPATLRVTRSTAFHSLVLSPPPPRTRAQQRPPQHRLIQAATWNVTGLLEPGKLWQVIHVMQQQGLAFLALTETHSKDSNTFTSHGYTVFHSCQSLGVQTFTGVAFVCAPWLRPFVHDVRPHSGRLMSVTLNTARAPTTVIVASAPHEGLEEEVREQLWHDLSTV